MTHETPYFVHSGKATATSILLMIIFGAFAALLLSTVYGYAIAYIPFIYINFFITLGFGGLTGMAVGMGGKIGKARRPGLYFLIGLAAGLLAEYAGWVAWIYASSDQTLFFVHPDELLPTMELIAVTGAWSIFGWTPTGFALYIIWAIEALIVIGGSALVAYVHVESTPFCEQCSKWVENAQTIAGFQAIDDGEAFKRKLEEGLVDMVPGLEIAGDSSLASTVIEINRCNCCDNSNYLSLTTVNVSVDDKGKESKDTDTFVRNLKITSSQYAQIEALS
ncbi:hypothetical protein [Psychromonas aquimarina]|uniref:hypothetical protein n=1 Tax=Psychromonas aquimarina TaxID=444919 RepID=UPI0004236655|nr:hypothetical protein [Psychromonas aquimarina]